MSKSRPIMTIIHNRRRSLKLSEIERASVAVEDEPSHIKVCSKISISEPQPQEKTPAFKDEAEVEADEDSPEGKQTWANKLDFLIALLGLAIGLGNVWRFPYLAFKNGGGAFLIPYVVFACCCGAPLFFLEISLGQFTQRGAIKCWDILPKLKGIGIASIVMLFYSNTYYIVILAWATFYLFSAFIQPLEFTRCDNSWNTPQCYETSASASASASHTALHPNQTVSSAEEFWVRRATMIYKSSGIEDLGGVVLHLAGSLFFIWAVCFLCLFRGIRVSGKVVYFTALFPYVLIACFILRGITLPGAMDGIMFYVKPDFTKLKEAQVWVDAGSQVFYSYATAVGCLTTYGSFNKFNHNVLKDSMIISVANPATSIIAGFGVFSVLGHLAHITGMKVADVTASGPGLVFKVYPVAISLLPHSNIWAILFFFMIILLGFDSQFAAVESFVSSVSDVVPWLRASARRRTLFLLSVCALHFTIALTMVTTGGVYMFELWNNYALCGKNMLIVGLAEITAIAYVYGHGKYHKNLVSMLGRSNWVLKWFIICWRFISPVLLIGLFIFDMTQYLRNDDARLRYGDYIYPRWATFVGWSFILSAVGCIPFYFIYYLAFGRFRDGNIAKLDGLQGYTADGEKCAGGRELKSEELGEAEGVPSHGVTPSQASDHDDDVFASYSINGKLVVSGETNA